MAVLQCDAVNGQAVSNTWTLRASLLTYFMALSATIGEWQTSGLALVMPIKLLLVLSAWSQRDINHTLISTSPR